MRKQTIPFNKIVPNMITSGSVLCGMFSLLLTYKGHFLPSAFILIMAVFFDYMDGKVARSLGGSSAFGEELDSLADVISFGAAPAFLMYAKYMDEVGGFLCVLGAAFFALCGALRLARFNVTHIAGAFQGIPIPAAGMALASVVIADIPLPPYFALAIMTGLACLMVSSVRYGNLKLLRRGCVNRTKVALLMLIVLSCVAVLHEKSPLTLISIYIASGPLGVDWGAWLSTRSDKDEKPNPEEE